MHAARLLLAATALCAVLGAPARAGAQAGDPAGADAEAEAENDAPVFTRRGNFTLGLHLGAQLGSVSGFPADYDKREDPQYAIDLGGSAGGVSLFVGATLQDWFTFSLGFGGVVVSDGDVTAAGGALLIRLDTYPLFPLGGALRDLAISPMFGFGNVIVSQGERTLAESLGASVLGLGVFHETFFGWGFVFGPAVDYLYAATENLSTHALSVGVRLAYHSQPDDRR